MTREAEAAAPRIAGPRDRGLSTLAAVTVAIWFGGVLFLAAVGAFAGSPTQPPLEIFLAVVLPPLLFALLYRLSGRFRDFALAIDLRWLTALQSWRVIGVMFLAFYAFGLLPGLFAWPAGLGDAAVGLAAPFVLMAILRGAPNWQRRVFWLNIAGLIDFAGAIGTGVLTSNSAIGFLADGAARANLGELPLSLVPSFAVPLWTIFHAISLLQLRQARAVPSD
jgi:hypothetical protein